MVDSKIFTPLTPEQTADWEYYFQLYRDIGYTGTEVTVKAWKDLCSKYPELANASQARGPTLRRCFSSSRLDVL